jgi:hypothetical protein
MFSFHSKKNQSTGWVFEQVQFNNNGSPMGRKDYMMTNIEQRQLKNRSGEGAYASHWILDTNQSTGSPQQSQSPTGRRKTHHTSTPQLYKEMYEKLMGREEASRIEQEYRLHNSSSSRNRVSIQELCRN